MSQKAIRSGFISLMAFLIVALMFVVFMPAKGHCASAFTLFPNGFNVNGDVGYVLGKSSSGTAGLAGGADVDVVAIGKYVVLSGGYLKGVHGANLPDGVVKLMIPNMVNAVIPGIGTLINPSIDMAFAYDCSRNQLRYVPMISAVNLPSDTVITAIGQWLGLVSAPATVPTMKTTPEEKTWHQKTYGY